VLTLFSIPKPFVGPIGVIQRNALVSWTALGVQVVLLGDDEGVERAAAEHGAVHLGAAAQLNRQIRLDQAFTAVDRGAEYDHRCLVNADVLLFDDVAKATHAVTAWRPWSLVVGRTIEVAVDEVVGEEGLERIRVRARATGVSRGAAALDYFVFPAGRFGAVPPFAVGRAGFDNWLVWRARQDGAVVDASDAVLAVHQAHTYDHLAGGKTEAYYGAEAEENVSLAGGRRHIYTLHDASHRLRADGRVTRNLGSIFRIRETARKIAWKLGRR
jgi:hypothetical protein